MHVPQLSVVEAILVLLLGLLYLFYGWQVFGVMVTTSGVLVGAAIGYYLSLRLGIRPYILTALTGITGGLVSVPARRVTVFLLAGICGGGVAVWLVYMGTGQAYSLATILAGLGGFLLLGILAALFLRPVVVGVSSLVGAVGCSWATAIFAGRLAPGALHPYWRGVPVIMIGLAVVLLALGVASQATTVSSAQKQKAPRGER